MLLAENRDPSNLKEFFHFYDVYYILFIICCSTIHDSHTVKLLWTFVNLKQQSVLLLLYYKCTLEVINHLQICLQDKYNSNLSTISGKICREKNIPKIFALFKTKLLQSIIGERSIGIDFP